MFAELGQGGGADVGAGAAHTGDDVVEKVLDPTTVGIKPHPGCRDPFFEQGFPGAVEGRITDSAGNHSALRRHAVALFVRTVVAVTHQVTGGFVGTGEPRPDHHVGGPGGQLQCHVPRMPDSTVRPYMTPEIFCRRGTLEYGRELWPAHAGHHPGGAHRTRTDTDLDDARAGVEQIARALRG